MRCPDCNKFVSFEQNEPEVDTVDVDESGHVTAEVHIVNSCADCGTELKEANLEMEGDVKHVCKKKQADDKQAPTTPVPSEPAPEAEAKSEAEEEDEEEDEEEESPVDFEVEESGSERTERSEGAGRYRKTFYGASVDVTVKCLKCKEEIDLTLKGDVQASDMEEMV